jgi:hypothetical protein
MTSDQYHEILVGLDRVLDCFDRSGVLMSQDDLTLKHELRVIRSNVLKAESGHPFPFMTPRSFAKTESEPEITPAPWQIGYDPRE